MMTNTDSNSSNTSKQQDTPLSESSLQRFGGIIRLYGTHGLQKLHNSHVLIIGIGGVGSWAAEAFARSGIGHITLMDLDDVCVSNINRQIHATQKTIGQAKTQAMKERLLTINPELQVDTVDDFLDHDNIEEYVHKDYHLVIDAIDAVMVKTKLINHCKRQKTPIITVGSAGGKRDPQQITSRDLSKTQNDPLLSKVRNNLRRLHGFTRNPKYRFAITAIYSTEQMTYPDNEGGVCQTKEFLDDSARLDCSQGFGAATMVTATFAFVAVTEGIKKLIR